MANNSKLVLLWVLIYDNVSDPIPESLMISLSETSARNSWNGAFIYLKRSYHVNIKNKSTKRAQTSTEAANPAKFLLMPPLHYSILYYTTLHYTTVKWYKSAAIFPIPKWHKFLQLIPRSRHRFS